MSRKNVRVVIPRNADELIELGEGIVAKHNEDPTASPLVGLDMADFEAKVIAAKDKSADVKQLRRDAEMATEDRDDLLGHKKDQNISTSGTVLNFVARSRDILLGAFKGNEQRLGGFGFTTVNQTNSDNGDDSGSGTPPATTATLSGTVTDQMTLLGVGNAMLEIVGTGVVGATDPMGNFGFGGVPLGNQTLRVSAAGYSTQEIAVNITQDGLAVVNVQLIAIP